MGVIHAELTLMNAGDFSLSLRGIIKPEEIRQVQVKALVDTGCDTLAINENIMTQLGLVVVETFPAELADGQIENVRMSDGVEIRFANRRTMCNAYIMPGNAEPLLGAIPIEGMDVVIDLNNQKLIVNPEHPYKKCLRLK